jgi:lipoyl-dependent peroxiredoxin subunit D
MNAETELETLLAKIPDPAKDLRLNLGSLERAESLTASQLWGAVLATALASRQADVIRWAAAGTRARLDPAAFDAARTAAAVMAMNNVYYRTRHLVGDPALDQVPARLRMQGLQTHGAPQADFELWCVAVSAVNGCGMCLQSHVAKLREAGVGLEAVTEVMRVAAIVAAVAATVEAEAALAA